MSADELLREALRVALDLPEATRPPRQGAQCPSIPRLLDAAEEGTARLTEQERSHIPTCALCQAALRAAFSERCPGEAAVAPAWAGGLGDSSALQEHRDGCPRCQRPRLRSPRNYTRIGLAATPTLRAGATSPFARLLRDLTPYFRQHRPHLYAVEGSYRTILSHGLLRDYPPEHLHCLPAGHLGGLVDLGAAVVGDPVVGLDAALGDAADVVASRLGLNSPAALGSYADETGSARTASRPLELDCVIYLIDPQHATSALPETLALKRECAAAQKPLLDTYASAAEWFGLLGYTAASEPLLDYYVPEELLERLPDGKSDHRMIALVAHDSRKAEVVNFASRHVRLLKRFRSRVATGSTAELLNGEIPDRLPATADLRDAVEKLQHELTRAGVEQPWVHAARHGSGGGLQISEMLAMGLCDAVLSFQPQGTAAKLYERSAQISNQAERIGGPSDIVCLHDPRSADVWAELWEQVENDQAGATPTLITAVFRRLFGVELVLAETRDNDLKQWEAIAEEAAWYLVGTIAGEPPRARSVRGPKRVVVSSGSAVRDVIDCIEDAALQLCQRIDNYDQRLKTAVEACKAAAPDAHARCIIDSIADRKRLSLRPSADNTTLWSIGDLVVAPMVGRFGSTDPTVEADENAALLTRRIGGTALELGGNAFIDRNRPADIPAEIDKHWHNADVVLMSCADLDDHWFGAGGKVALYEGMYDELKDKAVGDLAGLYLDAEGQPVEPVAHRRRGMTHADIDAVARGTGGQAAILVAGAHRSEPGALPDRAGTVLAALRRRLVSVLITDLTYAQAVLRAYADREIASPEPTESTR